MSVRFNRLICCVLVLILQCVLLPIYSIAADEIQAKKYELKSVPVEGQNLQNIPPQTIDRLLVSPSFAQVDGSRQDIESFDVSGHKSLFDLVGRAEISVQADDNSQFISHLIEYQMPGDELASQVGEANLLESISAGRIYNRESRAASARRDQAAAQTGQTLALLLPSVSVRANRGYEKSTPGTQVDDTTGELVAMSEHKRTDVVLTVTQTLFNLATFQDWRRTKVKELASEESYRVKDGDAYISTIEAYLSLVSSRLQADVAGDFEAQLAELLSYIEKRAGAGAATVSDMARVRARSEAIFSTRLELESAHRAAGTDFVRLTNLVPEKIRLPVLEDVGVSMLPGSFDSAVAKAMSANPEIGALEAELQAEEISRFAAKGRFLPRVEAEYTDTYTDNAGGSESTQRDRRVMMVLNWNLFSGGKDYNYHLERTARHRELQYRLDDQRRRVVQSLSANYAAFELTAKRIDSGYLELKSISTAADAMSKRMFSGNQSLLDLLDVYNQRYMVRSRLVKLHIFEMNTVAQLVRLTHGAPWPTIEEPSEAVKQKQPSSLVEPYWNDGA